MTEHPAEKERTHSSPSHRYIWLITGGTVLLAVVVLAVRSADAPTLEDHSTEVARMLEAVEKDPRIWRDETQRLLENSARLAEESILQTAETYYALGIRLNNEDRHNEAEQAFRESARLRPDWARPRCGLGSVLHALGEIEQAESSYRKAIELEPNWSRPWNDLAVLLRMSGRLEEAETAAHHALTLEPLNVATQNNLGNLLMAQGKYVDAERHYLTARELKPDHPAPHYNLACLKSITGRLDEVEAHLAQAIHLDPAFIEAARRDADLIPVRDTRWFAQLVNDTTL